MTTEESTAEASSPVVSPTKERHKIVSVRELKVGDCFKFSAKDKKIRQVVEIESERAGFSEVVVAYNYVEEVKASGSRAIECSTEVFLVEQEVKESEGK